MLSARLVGEALGRCPVSQESRYEVVRRPRGPVPSSAYVAECRRSGPGVVVGEQRIHGVDHRRGCESALVELEREALISRALVLPAALPDPRANKPPPVRAAALGCGLMSGPEAECSELGLPMPQLDRLVTPGLSSDQVVLAAASGLAALVLSPSLACSPSARRRRMRWPGIAVRFP